MPRGDIPDSIDSRIERRVQRSASGSVFTPASFAEIGSREAIDKALQRLVKDGKLRRLSRGLYDKPRHDKDLGLLWPSIDAVMKAITGRESIRLQPSGAYAANLLGLSEQVPAKVQFLTDGISRTLRAGPMRIELKRTTPRNMAAAGRLGGLVIQAFKNLGPRHITPDRLARLRRTIPATERAKLIADLKLAPAWMRPMMRELASDEPNTRPEGRPRKTRS